MEASKILSRDIDRLVSTDVGRRSGDQIARLCTSSRYTTKLDSHIIRA
jgi:hypothetical protein